jgi:zinc transport system permease protein
MDTLRIGKEQTDMPDLTFIYEALGKIFPFDVMQARFMQQAMVALILLAPMCAAMGVSVINSRMAFFSDAISHSAFAGIAVGLILGFDVRLSMIVFAALVGVGIMSIARRSHLSLDTIIGVFFSVVIAFGLAIVSRNPSVTRNIQQFLYGDILTITDKEIWWTFMLFVVIMIFQCFSFNRIIFCGLNSPLASACRVNTGFYSYSFSVLLSLVVIFSVWAMGVLLVTAMLIVPAATARNFAKTIGGMYRWTLLVSLVSVIAGLIISAQDWARTATGATIILCSALLFVISCIPTLLRKSGN